eukprot:8809161-Alexandrium_andersonii.AAC.1
MTEGGFNWNGVVCSSWVWVNRGTSKRDAWNPLGSEKERLALRHRMASLWAAPQSPLSDPLSLTRATPQRPLRELSLPQSPLSDPLSSNR